MGQAAVDLPDPLNPPPVTAASTDDLLAQMAGDEIDRLLAESEAPPANPPPSPDSGSVNSAAPASAAALESAVAPVGQSVVAESAPGAKPPSGSPASAATSESSDAQLDNLLAQLTAEAPQPAAAGSSAPAESGAGGDDLSAEGQSDAALAAERGALNGDGAASSETDAGDSARAALLGQSPAPFYLRILELLNAPLALAPDHVREAVGKIALVTLINAASVLIYVLFFRHHHG